ncbi:xanthine dehydrogenase family protein molybdopterin-binding subunit [Marinobacter sp. 2_MG-2023]|uniref:xanthine dehydrogenase family protein molybdopterin-binding subunit n=1 Tax=Marinobacter sp. 2_MG-2023 TaxID=3062679 RepID=UPI0026E1F18D|nr:molybdopterin cofactor-binding domain-containing protein [Marinobacter sp. 2_MG-2023]MDO6443133.1 molybdopterin-dependent oxidoreductase [Marinobacter sp. 2_MG-2023]
MKPEKPSGPIGSSVTLDGDWVRNATSRMDLTPRIEGRLAYTTDQRHLPGLLHGAILRSAHAHARITGVDISRAREMPGVHAVVSAADVPGPNRFGIVIRDQPVFCDERVRYEGDSIAAVAADTPEQALAALDVIEVGYQPLPVVSDAALAEQQVALHNSHEEHGGSNLLARETLERGDLEDAFSRCTVIVEHHYQTPRQMHAFMETEGGVAIPDDNGGVLFRVGCQSGHRDAEQLADILGLAHDQVTVESTATGGAFGGKDELTVQPAAGLLALKTGRPVMIHLDRFESCRTGIKRHPVTVKMTTGCDAAGRLLAHKVEAVLDTGAYASLGPAVLENYLDHATAPLYRIEAYRVSGRLVYTNNGVCGAFRGFGGNQATFAVESQLDALAGKLGMEPSAFRQINLRSPGDAGSRDQTVRWTAPPAEVLAAAVASPLWRCHDAGTGRWLTGTGMAMGAQGNGLGDGLPDSGGGRISLSPAGHICVEFGFSDYGQNIVESIIQSVCNGVGCRETDVEVALGNSRGPDSGPTSASRSSVLVHGVLARILPGWMNLVRGHAAGLSGHPEDRLVFGPGGLYFNDHQVLSYRELAASVNLDELSASASQDFPVAPDAEQPVGRYLQLQIATVARVAVDRLTGRVRVTDLHHVTAAGRVIYPPGYLGQIEGAAVMGQGMALTEDMTTRDGCYLADNLDQYLIPTFHDAPVQRVDVLDSTPEDDPFPIRGVGELGIEAVAPAITAAIEMATGVRIRRLPVDPGDLLVGMAAQEQAL